MKRVIRRIVTVVTTEVWVVVEDESGVEGRTVEVYTLQSVMKNDDFDVQGEMQQIAGAKAPGEARVGNGEMEAYE